MRGCILPRGDCLQQVIKHLHRRERSSWAADIESKVLQMHVMLVSVDDQTMGAFPYFIFIVCVRDFGNVQTPRVKRFSFTRERYVGFISNLQHPSSDNITKLCLVTSYELNAICLVGISISRSTTLPLQNYCLCYFPSCVYAYHTTAVNQVNRNSLNRAVV